MADVTSAAGVAISTVSRALSNPDRVNERTRERILEAARDLAYIPNAMARNLRRGATQTAMVVVPGRPTSPVVTDLVAGIDEVMSEAGYRLIMGRMDREHEGGRFVLDPSLSGTVDGAFVVSSTVPHFVERSLADTGIPLASYCSVARGAVFKHPEFAEIGATYGKSAAQVVLRWILQKGVSINTMSTKPANIAANFDVMDFTLSSVDLARIEAKTATGHRCVDPGVTPWIPEWD